MHDPRQHYAAANRHIVKGICRLADQRARCETLRFAGYPVEDAERLVWLLERTLENMRHHLKILESEIAEWSRLR
jgi:hypothetical protein